MRRLRIYGRSLILLAVAVATASMVTHADAFAAGPSGGFSVRPAHVDPADPATRSYFKAVIAPGQSYVDQVLVGNTSDTPIDLVVSPVDGLTGATSGAVYANRQDPVAKTGAWVLPNVATLRVGPHSETAVGFGVRVPADATPGDHLAGIAFEDAKPHTSGQRFSVTEIIRAVIGVLIQVPGSAQFRPDITTVELAPLPGVGTSAVMIGLSNNGSKLGKPGLAVSIDGPAAYHRSMSRQLDTLLPGDTIPFPFAWPDTLQAGDYNIVVTVIGGVDPVVFRTRVHLGTTLPARRTPKPSAHHTDRGLSWLLLAATGLGGGLLGAVIMRRPRRGAPSEPSPARPSAAPGPTRRRGRVATRRRNTKREPAVQGSPNPEVTGGSKDRSGN
jgi:hypothetical protein